jgi:uncharacterized sulfatase
MNDDLYEWMADGLQLSDREWEMLFAMYDATIKYVDACVGELFDFVQEELGETIFVVTSDHGDLFGEQGLLGHHIILDDGVIRVPMVVHGLDGVDHQRDQPVGHIDVMQTVLSAVGADTTQFQGHDLRGEPQLATISQDFRGTVDDDTAEDYERIRQYNPEVDLSHLPQSLTTAVRTTEFKLVRTDEWDRLYKLPDATEDVTSEDPDTDETLDQFHRDWEAQTEPFEASPEPAELDDEMEQHLRDMGYIQ